MLGSTPSRIFRSLFSVAILVAVAAGSASCRRDPIAAKRRYVESGDKFEAAGRHAEALLQYRNAIAQDPRDGHVRLKLANAFLATGDFGNGLREHVRAADLLPDDLDLQVRTGNLLLVAHQSENAKDRAEKVLAKQPSHIEAQILLANALAGLKDLDGAVAQIEEALRIAPERSGAYSNLGVLELGRGKRDAAEDAFKKAVELQPNSPLAHLALGNFYWFTERMSQAEQSLTRARDLDPRQPLTNRSLANFYLATNRAQSAEEPLKAVYEVTKTPEAAVALEEYYAGTGQDARARAVLEPMLIDPKTSAAANVRLAALDFRGGHRADAYQRLTRVLEKDQANLQALLLQSSFLFEDQKIEEALASASMATKRHPDSAAAFFVLGRIQSARRQTDAAIEAYQEVLHLNPRATPAKIALGQLQLAQGRADASVGLATEALVNEPGNADAQLLYVRGLLAQGELARAGTELKALMARFPNAAAVHTQMGMFLARQNKVSPARAEFERALQLRSDDIEALGGLVALDMAARNVASARARVDAQIAAAPTPALLTLAARVYAASDDFARAETLLKQAIKLDGSFVTAYGALAQLYLIQHKLDAAQAEFESIVVRSPKSVTAYTMVGMLLQAKGDIGGARDRFERVLQIDPEAAVAANNLAWIYAQHDGNLDVAMHLAQTAQKRMPDVAEVGDTLGFIYYKKGLTSLAISTLKVSVGQNPTNPIFQYHLGLAYAGAGDMEHAIASLKRSLTLKSDFDGADQARSLISSHSTQ
jgi:tetratricopeptide (TPR) repeat protein